MLFQSIYVWYFLSTKIFPSIVGILMILLHMILDLNNEHDYAQVCAAAEELFQRYQSNGFYTSVVHGSDVFVG